MNPLDLDTLRHALIRQEETIIFSLIERAQFARNQVIYEPGAIPLPEFSGCFSDYLLYQTEIIHAKVRRYTSPDEHAFFCELPQPVLPELTFPEWIQPNSININDQIHRIYKDEIIPLVCCDDDDNNYGSSATSDVTCLQALSKRIHYGKFVAEAKYLAQQNLYRAHIDAGDQTALCDALTDSDVEDRLLRRVELKAAAFGRDPLSSEQSDSYKIAPAAIADIYRRWLIPLTKEVEVAYLLRR